MCIHLTIFTFYQVNIFYPFMDHVLQHMEQRFPKQIKGVMTLSYLVPNKLHLITSELIEQWQSEFKYELTETGSELEQEVFNFF